MGQTKQLDVYYGLGHQLHVIVRLNGITPEERLTPKMARRASRVAHGIGYDATVHDQEYKVGYRLYKNSARKLHVED